MLPIGLDSWPEGTAVQSPKDQSEEDKALANVVQQVCAYQGEQDADVISVSSNSSISLDGQHNTMDDSDALSDISSC